jgi:hypothetical protein
MSKILILFVLMYAVFGLAVCDENDANNSSNLGRTLSNSNTNSALNRNAANEGPLANGQMNSGNRSNSGGANPGGSTSSGKPGGDVNVESNLGDNR